MRGRQPISKTMMIQATRQTANKLCLKERSSGVWLEEQLKMGLQLVNQKLHNLQTKKSREPSLVGSSSKKCFLPGLKKFIKVREEEAKTLRSKMIIQLMCIVLLRIKYRMHSAALVVLLYIGNLLEHMTGYEYSMRRLVYALIGKLSGGMSGRFATQLPAHFSMQFRVLLQNVFRERFEARLRKSRLIVERTFEDLLQEVGTTKPQSSVRLPQEIHPDMLSYKQITVNIDRKSLTFSYQYPKLLQERVPLRQYRFFVSKLNQIIAPEAVCYNISAVLRIFYLPLLTVLLAVAVVALVLFRQLDRQWQWDYTELLPLGAIFVLVAALSLRIFKYEKFYKNPLPIHKEMDKVINEMSERYWSAKTVFRIGDSIESFNIYIETPEEDRIETSSSSSSSESDTQINEELRQQCSLKQFFEGRKNTFVRTKSQRLSIMAVPELGNIDTIQEEDERKSVMMDTPVPCEATHKQEQSLFNRNRQNEFLQDEAEVCSNDNQDDCNPSPADYRYPTEGSLEIGRPTSDIPSISNSSQNGPDGQSAPHIHSIYGFEFIN